MNEQEPHSKNAGYVYILSNPAMPGIYKIGRSKNSGRVRANDIYKQGGTGVPMPFKMEFEIWSDDCVEAEINVHEELMNHRINHSREFFKIDLNDAVYYVISCAATRFEVKAGHYDSTLTKDDTLPQYYRLEQIAETLFPGLPLEVTMAQMLESISEKNAASLLQEKAKIEKQRLEERRIRCQQ